METKLAKREELPLDVVRDQPAGLSIEQAWTAVVKGDMNAERLAVMKDLLAMNAQQLFAQSFVELQMELPIIPGGRGVPDKNGNIKFKYANFEDIDAIVRPICLKHGFTYSFREGSVENGRITTIMTLSHRGGHSREVPYGVRIGQGAPGTTEPQADAGAHTYGMRGALEQGLALRIVGERGDARMEGGPVTEEQAFELERRCKETNSNVEMFLKFAGAKSFKEIPASAYARCDEMLRKKEAAR